MWRQSTSADLPLESAAHVHEKEERPCPYVLRSETISHQPQRGPTGWCIYHDPRFAWIAKNTDRNLQGSSFELKSCKPASQIQQCILSRQEFPRIMSSTQSAYAGLTNQAAHLEPTGFSKVRNVRCLMCARLHG